MRQGEKHREKDRERMGNDRRNAESRETRRAGEVKRCKSAMLEQGSRDATDLLIHIELRVHVVICISRWSPFELLRIFVAI